MLKKDISKKNVSSKNASNNLAEKKNKLSNDYISKEKLRKKTLKSNIRRNRTIAFFAIIICIITLSFLSRGGEQANSYENIGTLNIKSNVENLHKSIDSSAIDLNNQEVKSMNIIEKVPYINQSTEFPTGCEIASATMLLNYYGYNYTMEDLVDKFVPITQIDVDDDGNLVADSPYNSFIGDPRNGDSFGCFAPVIVKTLKAATDNEQNVDDISGMDLDKICDIFISNDIPVLVWETINMLPSYLSDEWKLTDGSGTFTWIAEEHCMVLIGYDEDYYYFNDPYENNGTVQYEKSLAEERYEELNKQAVVIVPAEYRY